MCLSHIRQSLKKSVITETFDKDPEAEDVKDHVKQAWERVQEEQDVDADDELPTEEPVLGGAKDKKEEDEDEDLNNFKQERMEKGEKDEVDEFLDGEKKETEEKDAAEEEEMDVGKFEGGKVRDAMEFPKWMERVQFGSKIPPGLNSCILGDARPDLINLLLLAIGSNVAQILQNFHRNYCGPIEEIWRQFQPHGELRIDLDPKIPYLGVNDEGELIEPQEYHLRAQYQKVGIPAHADDLGEDGFIRSYRGSLNSKKLVIYVLECGYYTPDDFREIFSSRGQRLNPKDTKEDEEAAHDQMEDQSIFMRRVIAGAFDVNAVYFFRNVNYANTVFHDPLDILCATWLPENCSPAHDFVNRSLILPVPLMAKFMKAIDEYNRSKRCKGQRPRPQWGSHLKEAHVLAIIDMEVPPDARSSASSASAKATPPLRLPLRKLLRHLHRPHLAQLRRTCLNIHLHLQQDVEQATGDQPVGIMDQTAVDVGKILVMDTGKISDLCIGLIRRCKTRYAIRAQWILWNFEQRLLRGVWAGIVFRP